MAIGRLTLVLSEWSAQQRAWILPKLQGLSVDGLLGADRTIDSDSWKYQVTGDNAIVSWISSGPPPINPQAVVRFRETSLLTKFADPTILVSVLVPALSFLGVIGGAYIQSRTQLIASSQSVTQTQDKHDLGDLVTKATLIGCNRGLNGVAAVTACIDDWAKTRTDANELQRTLKAEDVRNVQLQTSYDKLRVEFQQRCNR